MIFETYIPAFPLAQFIASFVYYKEYNPEHFINRLLPDGNATIIIDLTDLPKFVYDNETLAEIQTCRHAWFSGIRTIPISIPSGRASEMFIINFHHGKSYPFVSCPANELADTVVDAEIVSGKEILAMRDKLLDAASPKDKFHIAEAQLLKLYKHSLHVNPFIDYAISRIIQSPSEMSIREIAAKVGFSQKHLIKVFKDHVGLTPKNFARVIRFQQAISEIEKMKFINWANIAYECGYYDQSHFIAEFKTFSGYTPNQFLQMQRSY